METHTLHGNMLVVKYQFCILTVLALLIGQSKHRHIDPNPICTVHNATISEIKASLHQKLILSLTSDYNFLLEQH